MVTLGDNGEVVYEFDISEAGTYDLVVKLGFPLWDKNSVYLSLDGTSILIEETGFGGHTGGRLLEVCMEGSLSFCGTHTLAVSVAAKGVQFYGFKVCQSFRRGNVR